MSGIANTRIMCLPPNHLGFRGVAVITSAYPAKDLQCGLGWKQFSKEDRWF
jgi:hypothetical protein